MFGRANLPRPGIRSASFASTPGLDQGILLASSKAVEDHYPKTVVVPIVVRVVVVALNHAGVVQIVVPRPAAQRQIF
jgi:hypothetical protein